MKKILIPLILALFLIAAFVGLRFYNFIFKSNVSLQSESAIIHIPTQANLNEVLDSLTQNNYLKNPQSFLWVADKMKYNQPKPGRYRIQNNWNNKELIGHLRSGKQEAIKLTFNNQRTIDDLCELFGQLLEPKSDDFVSYFLNDSLLNETGLDSNSVMSLFIPNTYNIYWNSSPATVYQRMKLEHQKFWNEERMEQLSELGLNQVECYTLASIVQKETNLNSEKPIIAGVYLNRLNRGMLLQADPTVVYAVGDFEIRRVLNKHLEIDSPYNTYKYPGLPPGPIAMPDISTIDAVLNAASHNYLYFCVKPGNDMAHAFASTLTQHLRNAREYQRWLNSQRIFN